MHVQQQAQAAAVEGLHTRMEMLQQASFQDNQDTQRTIQDLGLQFRQGKPFFKVNKYPLNLKFTKGSHKNGGLWLCIKWGGA